MTDKDQRKAVLLSVCGAQTYKLIRNLLAPQTPDADEYDDIVKRVQDHVRAKPSVILQRFRFNSLNRKEGESVADFVTELRRLSTDCAFGDTLSDMLRVRLVCGINEEKIQRRLLQEVNLTFEDALRIARAMETAAKNSLEMQQGGLTSTATQVPLAVHQTSSTRDHTPEKSKCSSCLGWHSFPSHAVSRQQSVGSARSGAILRERAEVSQINKENQWQPTK